MSMKTMTLRIIAPAGLETGFMLGGAETVVVTDTNEFNGAMEEAIHGGDVGILAIPVEMETWISAQNRKVLEKAVTPMLAVYDYPVKWRKPALLEAPERPVFHAAGYHIRIKM